MNKDNHRIYFHEEHGEVLETWRCLGYTNVDLLYFDRHLDLKCISDAAMFRISENFDAKISLTELNRQYPFQDFELYPYGLDNFLYPAIKLGMLKTITWVYPEPDHLTVNELGKILIDQLSLIPGTGAGVKASYRESKHYAAVQIFNVELHITTLRRLSREWISTDIIVDIDLDYFGLENGELLHSIEEVAATLNQLNLARKVNTLTYSISSGFMAESLRCLGQTFIELTSSEAVVISSRRPTASSSMKIIANNTKLTIDEFTQLLELEIEPSGPSAYSLASVLALRIPDLALAETYYHKSEKHECKAHWAAYSIGLFHMQGKSYEQAACWLRRARGSLVDTLQNHAVCLEAICEFRLGNFKKSLEIAKFASERLPMRKEVQTVLHLAAIELNTSEVLP